MSKLHTSLVWLIFSGRVKTKLKMLTFSYYGGFVKNSIDHSGLALARDGILPNSSFLLCLSPRVSWQGCFPYQPDLGIGTGNVVHPLS